MKWLKPHNIKNNDNKKHNIKIKRREKKNKIEISIQNIFTNL